jgi:hypothetical protein
MFTAMQRGWLLTVIPWLLAVALVGVAAAYGNLVGGLVGEFLCFGILWAMGLALVVWGCRRGP